MENHNSKASIFELLALIDDFILVKIISFLGSEQLLMFGRLNRKFNHLTNDPKLWRKILKDEFNWPPKHAPKGKKKHIREQLGSTISMKAILIEQMCMASSQNDNEILSNLIYVLKHAITTYPGYTNDQAKRCNHQMIGFFPEDAKNYPKEVRCSTCGVSLPLRLTKMQMLKHFRDPDAKDTFKQIVGVGTTKLRQEGFDPWAIQTRY